MTQRARQTTLLIVFAILGIVAGVVADRVWQTRFANHASHASAEPTAPAAPDSDEEPEIAAIVRTAVAAVGELPRRIEGLGSAITPPTGTTVESWPADVFVSQILVQPGETVSKDTPLVQVTATRDVETLAATSQLAIDTTAKALDLAQQRLDRGLGNRSEVLTAQTAHDEAKQRLERLRTTLPPQDGLLRSHTAGVVGTIRVQAGGIAAANAPLVDIVSEDIIAQVGIDPAVASAVEVGQQFEVRPIDDRTPGQWTGTVWMIARLVNPTTRLVDVTLVFKETKSPPRLGTPLRATMKVAGVNGVTIPRSALVPEEDELIVYVVRNGAAARTPVTLAQRGDDRVVLASGCAAGDHVVTSGQSQLTNGATVREITTDLKPAQKDGGAGADH